MDEVLFAEVGGWGVGIVSLLDPTSDVLAVWGAASRGATAVAKCRSETAPVPAAPSRFPGIPPPLLRGEQVARLAGADGSGAAAQPPQPVGAADQASAGPGSLDGEAGSAPAVLAAAW